MIQNGYDVRVFEKRPEPVPLGGGVLLSVPVLAILRRYGVDVGERFGSQTRVEFRNAKGKVRARLPFNPLIEKTLGIPGWHYGVLRSSAFSKMLALVPDGVIHPDSTFHSYEERADSIVLRFAGGGETEADIVVGADGIRSGVSRQAFGDHGLFHVGLRLWLAWCGHVEGVSRDTGAIAHSRRMQASYFPMLHDGEPGFEWWIVEPSRAHDPAPADVEGHVRALLAPFADPLPRFPDHTNFETQIFRWDIYNRASLQRWTAGRVACIGDAVHPVSPYAAYGMGMAIEDGYFLARALGGADLNDPTTVQSAFERFESERVSYVNHHVEFARTLGRRFHHAPPPVALVRDFVFDNTKALQALLTKGYLADQEQMSLQLHELAVA
jgi:2-polyprenyl-6-methoxyphenol hydroxylase-like FAD-dependent oxidoreductase